MKWRRICEGYLWKGSKENFCQVDPDQSQEYHNRRCKIAAGIVGITRGSAELMNWSLGDFKVFDNSSNTLINIASKEMVTPEMQKSLLKAESNGMTQMIEVIIRISLHMICV